jgi:hypothetical protein
MYCLKGFNSKLSKYFFPNANTYFFFNNSDRDFYSVNNNVYTYVTKKKSKKKRYYIVYALHFALNIAQSLRYY